MSQLACGIIGKKRINISVGWICSNFVQGLCKQMLKVWMCFCRWLKKMSGSSCPTGTTPQQSLGPTPTSPRPMGSRCPNLTELRPPSDPPNLEPTSDICANQRWGLRRCRKKNRYAPVCVSLLLQEDESECVYFVVFHFVLLKQMMLFLF